MHFGKGINRQPYYGGGGLANFSLASRAPKAHEDRENWMIFSQMQGANKLDLRIVKIG